VTTLEVFQKVAKHELTPEEGADLLMEPKVLWFDYASITLWLALGAGLLWGALR
jgi:hypothetical protein